MKYVTTLAMLALGALTASATGQEDQAAGKKLFQEYGDAMVGVWESEITLNEDAPGLGNKGDKLRGYGTIRMILQDNAIEGNYRLGEVSGKSLTVWDPASKQIKANWTSSDGSVGSGTVEKDGDQWLWKGTTVLADGTKETGVTTIHVSDEGNTHTHVGTNRKRGDRKLPDFRDVWTRVSKTVDGLAPGQRRLRSLAFLIGEWETTYTNGTVERNSYEWMNNQSYIMYRSGEYKEIIGWDLNKRQFTAFCLGTHGGQAHTVWTVDGDTIKMEAKPAFYDRWGNPLESRATVTRVDDDTLKISAIFGDGTWEGESKRVKE